MTGKKLKNKLDVGKLVLSIVFCEGAGIIGAIFTTPEIKTWYTLINKPSFNPPNWLFGPVWTILFLLMGVALYFAVIKKISLRWFLIQLILNVFWSIAFFGLHNPSLALVDIVLMIIIIVLTIKTFYKVYKPAGIILLPYLAWVSFAAILNFAVWRLN